MKNLILGYGILGKELVRQTNWDYLCRDNDLSFNFQNIDSYRKKISSYRTIINCIANTNTYENIREKHWSINYKSVADLVSICNEYNQKLIHISTDYVYSGSDEFAKEDDVPVHNKTWYGYTKLLGDAHVQLKSNNFLIVRSGHKVKPFTYDTAFTDLIGNFDYVDKIASLIINLINKNTTGIVNLGTKTKNMYDLALTTKSDVLKDKSNNELMPKNVTMNISKMEKIL